MQIIDLYDLFLKKPGLDGKDQAFLNAFQELFAAGFSSRSVAIINRTLLAWEPTYGLNNALQYPPGVAKALRRLQSLVANDIPMATPLPPQDEEVNQLLSQTSIDG
jgi:hypothetical protein